MSGGFSLVPMPAPEAPIERIRRLEAEARSASLAEKAALIADLLEVAGRCAEVASLSSLPPGLREALRGLGRQIEDGVQSVEAVQIRARG